MGDERLPGVGLVDLDTVREDGPRLIGNVAIEVEPTGTVLAGLREPRRPHAPRGRERRRSGACCAATATTAASGFEGVRGGPHGTVVGTYLHGPLLPKNAWFADWLIATALGIAPVELAPLDDALEDAAHAAARRAAGLTAAPATGRIRRSLSPRGLLFVDSQHRPDRGAVGLP